MTVEEQGTSLQKGEPKGWEHHEMHTVWSEQALEAEGEDAPSTMKAPIQCSRKATVFVHGLSRKVSRIGSAGADPVVRGMLQTQALNCCFNAYSGLLAPSELDDELDTSSTISEQAAVQCIFDIRFMLLVFAGYHKGVAGCPLPPKELQKLLQSLSESVDPFNMDYYDTLIDTAIVRTFLRTALLLQPLAACNHQQLQRLDQSTAITEDPNILPLVQSSVRFPLLATTTVFPLPPSLANLDGNVETLATSDFRNQKDPSPTHSVAPTVVKEVSTESSGMGFFRSIASVF